MKPNPLAALMCFLGAGMTGSAIFLRSTDDPAEKLDRTASQVQTAPQPKKLLMKVTAYCLCKICCGKWAEQTIRKTSIGDDAKICDGVAADPKLLPYRAKLAIPGVGIREVDDTGGAMRQSARKGIHHLDVRMPAHEEAKRFGVRWLEVAILD